MPLKKGIKRPTLFIFEDFKTGPITPSVLKRFEGKKLFLSNFGVKNGGLQLKRVY